MKLFDIFKSEENKLIDLLIKGNPEPLIKYLEELKKPFHKSFFFYKSKSRRIVVEKDICGFEVKIDKGELLDCNPYYYGLTKETGDRLYNAILSNVPGSTAFDEKYRDKLK